MKVYYIVSYDYLSDYTRETYHESKYLKTKEEVKDFLEDAPYGAKNIMIDVTVDFEDYSEVDKMIHPENY